MRVNGVVFVRATSPMQLMGTRDQAERQRLAFVDAKEPVWRRREVKNASCKLSQMLMLIEPTITEHFDKSNSWPLLICGTLEGLRATALSAFDCNMVASSLEVVAQLITCSKSSRNVARGERMR